MPQNPAYNATSYKLVHYLLEGYNKHVKPVLKPSDQLLINVSASLYQMIEMVGWFSLCIVSSWSLYTFVHCDNEILIINNK